MRAEELVTAHLHRATKMVEMEEVVSTPPESLSSPECWWWGSASAVPSRALQGVIKAISPAANSWIWRCLILSFAGSGERVLL
jgi:hypothetical protein